MAVKANATTTLSFMVDVKATCRYYKLQASTASAPAVPTTAIPEGWTDIEPSYTEGSTNTLYTVDKTVFTNDTFVYSAVSKSTSYEAAKAAYNKAINAQNTANEAAKTATNFIQFVDGEGLYVGNNQTGTWEGVRTRMDTDSFDVIDQNGNQLASYGAELSITPNNTSGYKITMGNAVTIGSRNPLYEEGVGSVVIGEGGRASAEYAYAEGCDTNATGDYSHAEGHGTSAEGYSSHAEGYSTFAQGDYSHAEGHGTSAYGNYSHAEGYSTNADNFASHASGIYTSANCDYQFVVGRNNDTDDNAAFIIGNGEIIESGGSYSKGNSSNAFEVDWGGNALAYGNIRAYGNIYYNIPVRDSNYNIDTMKETGKYYCSGDEFLPGSTIFGKPYICGDNPDGWLEVMRYTDNYVHQRYSTCNGDVFERNCINGTWQDWRVVFYHAAMTATTAETTIIDIISDYPYTINIAVANGSNAATSVHSYMAFYNNSNKTAKIKANTSALESTHGTITASAGGITIKSTAAYKLYVTVTQ